MASNPQPPLNPEKTEEPMEDKSLAQHPIIAATPAESALGTPSVVAAAISPAATPAAVPTSTPVEKLDLSSISAAAAPAEQLSTNTLIAIMEKLDAEKPASSAPITAAEQPTSSTPHIVRESMEEKATIQPPIAVTEELPTPAAPYTAEKAEEKPVTDTPAVGENLPTPAAPGTTINTEEKPVADTPAEGEKLPTPSVPVSAEDAQENPITDPPAQTEDAEEKPIPDPPAQTEDREIPLAPSNEVLDTAVEESHHLRDLRDTQKKALLEFKAKIQAAIMDNSFLEPLKPAKAKKQDVKKEGGKGEKLEEKEEGKGEKLEDQEVKKDVSDDIIDPDVIARELPPTPEAVHEPSSDVAHVLPPVATTADDATPTACEIPLDEADVDVLPSVETTTDDATPTAREIPVDGVVHEPPAADDTSAYSAPVDESPSLDDLALWGIPLLHSKGDERTDVLLLKFLRAHDFKVNKALNMLQDTMVWRKDFNTDSLIDEEMPTDFHSSFIHGVDRDGHPVCYNGELTSKTSDDEAQLKKRIQVLEKGIQKLNFHPNGVHSMVQVTDFAGHSPAFLGRGVRSKILNLLQDNYPELVAKQIFINVPWYFKVLLSLNVISPRTKSKVVLARPGRVAETLFKYISPDQVPVQYGGLSRLNDTDFEGTDAPVTQVTIKAGEKLSIELPVVNAGSVVWDVAVTGWDVLYDEEFVPNQGYTRIIQKASKVANVEEPIRNQFVADEPGKVVLTIDNSASRRKRVAVYRHIVKAAASHI